MPWPIKGARHTPGLDACVRMETDLGVNEYRFALMHISGDTLSLAEKENDPMRYELITRQIRRALPTFKDFVLDSAYGKVTLRWIGQHTDKTFGAHLTSDGSLRMFCLFTLLNLPGEMLPDVVFFDEPEIGLHLHAKHRERGFGDAILGQ